MACVPAYGFTWLVNGKRDTTVSVRFKQFLTPAVAGFHVLRLPLRFTTYFPSHRVRYFHIHTNSARVRATAVHRAKQPRLVKLGQALHMQHVSFMCHSRVIHSFNTNTCRRMAHAHTRIRTSVLESSPPINAPRDVCAWPVGPSLTRPQPLHRASSDPLLWRLQLHARQR